MTYYAYNAETLGPYQVDPLDHLGLAVSIARRFKCNRLGRRDVEQEAFAALCVAARTFKPEKGFKFSTWAENLIRNHLRGVRAAYRNVGGVGGRGFLPKALWQHLQNGGGTKPEIVKPLLKSRGWANPTDWDCFVAVTTIKNQELSLSTLVHGDSMSSPGEACSLADTLEDEDSLARVVSPRTDQDYQRAVDQILEKMPERHRVVTVRRLLADLDDESTLQELGDEWGVTRERVRQVESQARVVLKKWLGEEVRGV